MNILKINEFNFQRWMFLPSKQQIVLKVLIVYQQDGNWTWSWGQCSLLEKLCRLGTLTLGWSQIMENN